MTRTAEAATELAREHDEIDRLATRVATHAPGTERGELVHELCTRFISHLQAEESYLFPALRRLLSDGFEVAAAQARRDRAVARTIERVECRGLQPDESDVLVAHLVVGVQDHVERHDTALLPALNEAGETKEIDRLGKQLQEGILAARQAAERAGACTRAERAPKDVWRPPAPDAADTDAAGGTRRRGFKALLARVVRGK
jgi:hypothetical protein